MNNLPKNNVRIFVAIISFVLLLSTVQCSGSWTTPIEPGPNDPGSINATIYDYLGGDSFSNKKCTMPEGNWTVSSSAGSSQTKKSPAVKLDDNVIAYCEPFEGSTSCYCKSAVLFTSLAPGTWNFSGGVSCNVDVKPGKTSYISVYIYPYKPTSNNCVISK